MAHRPNLNPMQTKFAVHFAEFGNATQAYLYASPKVSYESAKNLGSDLSRHPLVVEYIEQRRAEQEEKFAMEVDVTKENMVKDLKLKAEQAVKAGDFKAYATIQSMIIKMYGLFEPEKVEFTENQIQVIKTIEIQGNKTSAKKIEEVKSKLKETEEEDFTDEEDFGTES